MTTSENMDSSSTDNSSKPQPDQPTDDYCIRWKGFPVNIIHALEDLEDDFADVTLSCANGRTVQGHKLILASCSPYFRKLLQPIKQCQHPVLIFNDISNDILEALITYMYHGQVTIPHGQLDPFLKTARNLQIKGIAEAADDGSLPPADEQPIPLEPAGGATFGHPPANNLAILAATAAAAAAHSSPPVTPAMPQHIGGRRKTGMPRRLDVPGYRVPKYQPSSHVDMYSSQKLLEFPKMGSSSKSEPIEIDNNENSDDSNKAMNLSVQRPMPQLLSMSVSPLPKASLLSIPYIKQEDSSSPEASLDLSVPTKGPLDMSATPSATITAQTTMKPEPRTSPVPPLIQASSLLASGSNTPEPGPLPSTATPEQMAALLGPSWKSRQPRLCQYCQRMFSNKFNLKQHILNMHTVGRELQCELCQKKVKNKWYLRRHHVTHHGAPLKK